MGDHPVHPARGQADPGVGRPAPEQALAVPGGTGFGRCGPGDGRDQVAGEVECRGLVFPGGEPGGAEQAVGPQVGMGPGRTGSVERLHPACPHARIGRGRVAQEVGIAGDAARFLAVGPLADLPDRDVRRSEAGKPARALAAGHTRRVLQRAAGLGLLARGLGPGAGMGTQTVDRGPRTLGEVPGQLGGLQPEFANQPVLERCNAADHPVRLGNVVVGRVTPGVGPAAGQQPQHDHGEAQQR